MRPNMLTQQPEDLLWAKRAALARAVPLEKLQGTTVRDLNGKKVGDIVDVIVDLHRARVPAAIVSVGGFLGIGDHDVAIPSRLFERSAKGDLIVDLDKGRVEKAPAFKADSLSQVAYLDGVYTHFGATPYWKDSAPEGKKPDVIESTPHLPLMRGKEIVKRTLKEGDDRTIGKIWDLYVDLEGGRLPYAVVSSERGEKLDQFYSTEMFRQGEDKDAFYLRGRAELAKGDPVVFPPGAVRDREDVAATRRRNNLEDRAADRRTPDRELALRVSTLVGKDVISSQGGEKLGSIEDLILHFRSKSAPLAIIKSGDARIAVPIDQLRSGTASVELDASRAQLERAPRFPVPLGVSGDEKWADQLKFFGGNTRAPGGSR